MNQEVILSILILFLITGCTVNPIACPEDSRLTGVSVASMIIIQPNDPFEILEGQRAKLDGYNFEIILDNVSYPCGDCRKCSRTFNSIISCICDESAEHPSVKLRVIKYNNDTSFDSQELIFNQGQSRSVFNYSIYVENIIAIYQRDMAAFPSKPFIENVRLRIIPLKKPKIVNIGNTFSIEEYQAVLLQKKNQTILFVKTMGFKCIGDGGSCHTLIEVRYQNGSTSQYGIPEDSNISDGEYVINLNRIIYGQNIPKGEFEINEI